MKRMLAAALAGALALTLTGCGDQIAVFVSGGEPDLTLTPHTLSADAEQLAAIADLDVTMADYTANLGAGNRWLRLRLYAYRDGSWELAGADTAVAEESGLIGVSFDRDTGELALFGESGRSSYTLPDRLTSGEGVTLGSVRLAEETTAPAGEEAPIWMAAATEGEGLGLTLETMELTGEPSAALAVTVELLPPGEDPTAAPDQADRLAELEQEILMPMSITALASQSWTDPETLRPEQFVNFYTAKYLPAERDLSGPETVDAATLEAAVQGSFAVSSDFLRQAENYDAETGLYTLGYLGGGAMPEATGLETGPDSTELLRYVYLSPADGETVIRTGTLTLTRNGTFTAVAGCATEPVEAESLSDGTVQVHFVPESFPSGEDVTLYTDAETDTVIRADVIRFPDENWTDLYISAGREEVSGSLNVNLEGNTVVAAFGPAAHVQGADLETTNPVIVRPAPDENGPAQVERSWYAVDATGGQTRYRLVFERDANGVCTVSWQDGSLPA